MTGQRWVLTDPASGVVMAELHGTHFNRTAAQRIATLIAQLVGVHDARLSLRTGIANPTLVHHGMIRTAAWHMLREPGGDAVPLPLAELYSMHENTARKVAQALASGLKERVILMDNRQRPAALAQHPMEEYGPSSLARRRNPNRRGRVSRNVRVPGRMDPGKVDQAAAKELELFIDNDADLYRQQTIPILKNLWRKMVKGTYDFEKSVKLLGYLVENGGKKYARQFSSSERDWTRIFNPDTREYVARVLADNMRLALENHEYDWQGPKGNPPRPPRRQRRAAASGRFAKARHHAQATAARGVRRLDLQRRAAFGAGRNPTTGRFVFGQPAPTTGLSGQIRSGDRVTWVDRFGKQHTGRAVMPSQHGGWVLNMGGAHGTPAVVDDSNIVKVTRPKANARGRFGLHPGPTEKRYRTEKAFRAALTKFTASGELVDWFGDDHGWVIRVRKVLKNRRRPNPSGRKMRPADFAELRAAVLSVIEKHPTVVDDYRAQGLSAERLRWDLLHASKFPTTRLYSYLNDSHIDTALRSIVGRQPNPSRSAGARKRRRGVVSHRQRRSIRRAQRAGTLKSPQARYQIIGQIRRGTRRGLPHGPSPNPKGRKGEGIPPTVASFLEVLSTKLTQLDQREERYERKHRIPVNIHRLAHLIGALQRVREAVRGIESSSDPTAFDRMLMAMHNEFTEGFSPVAAVERQVADYTQRGILPSLVRARRIANPTGGATENPRNPFVQGERVTVPYTGRSSYFGRAVTKTRENATVEGYDADGLVHVTVRRGRRGGSAESHHFPADQVRRRPVAGRVASRTRAQGMKVRLELKSLRSRHAAALSAVEKARADLDCAEAQAKQAQPHAGEAASPEYLRLRSKMRKLNTEIEAQSAIASELEIQDPAYVDPWALPQPAWAAPSPNVRAAGVRGKASGNPMESVIARARRTFRRLNENEPGRITRVRTARGAPRVLAKLGELVSFQYRSNKYAGTRDNPHGKTQLYEHRTQRPHPVLATDPSGREVHIVGGRMHPTPDGLVN